MLQIAANNICEQQELNLILKLVGIVTHKFTWRNIITLLGLAGLGKSPRPCWSECGQEHWRVSLKGICKVGGGALREDRASEEVESPCLNCQVVTPESQDHAHSKLYQPVLSIAHL